jgi:hypothetical protein
MLIGACGHNPTITNTGSIPDQRKVSIDKTLLTPCKPIPELLGNTEVELMLWISDWKLVYLECKRNHAALINAIKSAFPSDSK